MDKETKQLQDTITLNADIEIAIDFLRAAIDRPDTPEGKWASISNSIDFAKKALKLQLQFTRWDS